MWWLLERDACLFLWVPIIAYVLGMVMGHWLRDLEGPSDK